MGSNAEPESLKGRLPGVGATRFTEIRHVGETGSTNADLLDQARRGIPGPVVLVTDHQTAGRGRQNRSWFDRPGDSLLVSVLIAGRQPWAQLIPLVTGLAVRDAIHDLFGDDDLVGLKWPNDILVPSLGERKLAGILVESLMLPVHDVSPPGGGGPPVVTDLAVVIGVGLNLRWSTAPPAEVRHRATTLAEVWHHHRENGTPPDDLRRQLLARYLMALDRTLDLTASTEAGTDGAAGQGNPILDRYRPACLTLGRDVAFETGTELVEGRAVDIGFGGELVIEDADGNRRSLLSGHAHHVSPGR